MSNTNKNRIKLNKYCHMNISSKDDPFQKKTRNLHGEQFFSKLGIAL